MSSSYATGKHARSACDRCGFVYDYNSLKELIINLAPSGLRVCAECYEKDHEQYQVGRIVVHDPQALRDPRPDDPVSPPAEPPHTILTDTDMRGDQPWMP